MVRRNKELSLIYVVSLAAHLAAGEALALLPKARQREVVSIALNEAPEPQPQPQPQQPTTHRPRSRGPARVHARPTPRPQPSAADAQLSFTDLPLTFDSPSAETPAQQAAQPGAAAPAPPSAAPEPRLLVTRRAEPNCAEPLQRPRPLGRVRPQYTDAARRARIEGRIRLELMVDERGLVRTARVLDGLGYGLDEAALAAAKTLRFAAATQCGRPVVAPFVVAMRFVLGP